MAKVTPPDNSYSRSAELSIWHQVFKPPWETLVAAGYVAGAARRMWTNCLRSLAAADGDVALFGDAVLEPEDMPHTVTSNKTFYGVSSSASDTAILRCWMVAADDAETLVDITLNGTTPVSIGSYIHCNMAMYLNGATQNVGTLTVSTKAIAGLPLIITDDVRVYVGIGDGHGNSPIQHCPLDQCYVFLHLDITSDKNDGVEIHVHRSLDINSAHHHMLSESYFIYSTAEQFPYRIPQVLSSGQELSISAERSASGSGNVAVCANWGQYVLHLDNSSTAGALAIP